MADRPNIAISALSDAQRAILLDLALLLNDGEPVEALFDRLATLLEGALEFDYVVVTALTDDFKVRLIGARPVLVSEIGAEIPVEERALAAIAASPLAIAYSPATVPQSAATEALVAAGMAHAGTTALREGPDMIGTFTVASRRDEPYTNSELEFIRLIGTMLGQSLAAHRRTERARAEVARSRLLNEVALLVNAGKPASLFFDQLSKLLAAAVPFDSMVLLGSEPDGSQLRVIGSLRSHALRHGMLIPLAAVFGDLALPEGNTVTEHRTSDVPLSLARAAEAAGLQRLAVVVLRDGPRLLGVLSLGREADQAFSAAALELLRLLAAFLGQSFANERNLEETRRQAAHSLLLSEVSILLNDGKPTAEVFARVIELMQPVLPWDRCGLYLADSTGASLVAVASVPGSPISVGTVVPLASIPVPLERWADEPSLVFRPRDLAAETSQRVADAGGLWATLTALRDGDRLLGFLSMGRDSDAPFTPPEVALLEFLATLLARSVAAEQRIVAATEEAARAALLNELGLLLTAGEDVEKLFDRLPHMLRKAISFDYIGVAVEAGRPGFLKTVDWHSREPNTPEPRWIARDALGLDAPQPSPAPIFQFRLAPETHEVGTFAGDFARAGIRRSAIAFLGPPERRVGILHIARGSPERFKAEEMAFFEVVATFFSQAVANRLRIAELDAEAEEQRIIAAVAAAAAAETDPGALVAALQTLRPLIPRLYAAFGYLEGGEVVFPSANAPPVRWPMDAASYAALKYGQMSADELPEELHGSSPLWAAGVHALTQTVARSRGSVVGFLLVGSRHKGFVFEERELRILNIVSQIIGPAMENARANERARLEAEEQKILADVAAAAALERDPIALLAGIVDPLAVLVPRPFVAYAHLLGDDAIWPSPRGHVRLPLSDTAKRAAESGQATGPVGPRPPEDPSAHIALTQVSYTTSLAGGVPIGLLYVATREPGHVFAERELRVFRLVAQLVGPAMENARAVERSRVEAEEQRILAEVASVAAREMDPIALLNGLVAPLRSLVPRPFLAYGHVDGDQMIWPSPEGEVRLPHSEGSSAALQLGQSAGGISPFHPDDPSRDFPLTQTSYTTALSGGIPIGLLQIATREPGHTFGDRELRIFRLLAQIVGPAMQNARSAKLAQVEAEEQRILAEVATAAARGTTIAEIIEGLRAALAGVVPRAFTFYGRFSEDDVIFDTVPPELAAMVRSTELRLPLTNVGRQTRDALAGMGSLSWSLGDARPVSWTKIADARMDGLRQASGALGLHQYCLLSYHAAGAPVGLLLVASADPDYAFSPAHIALLTRVTQIVGPAIEAVRAASNIARQGALYDLILRSLTEGVALLDRDANLVFANPFGAALMETVDPGSKRNGFADLTSLVPDGARADLTRTLSDNVVTSGRTSMVIDGEARWIDYELVPLDDGRNKLLVVTSEVTAAVRRETEQQNQRDQVAQASRLVALGELVGGVAHELNNPLTAVLGFSEILSAAPEAAPLAEEIAVIHKEALRARDIVRDLLLIARPAPVERADVALGDVIGHIKRLRHAAWVSAGTTVDIDIDGDECHIWGNENQIAQVMLNLVTNAEHALEDGGGCIRIRGHRSGGDIEITVSDTGAGMSPEIAARVFEPFFTTRQSAGNGLGLSLSRTMVLSQGGAISVESESGVGTTFTVHLPAYEAPLPSLPLEPRASPTGPVRVLVIDDEPSLRKVCQRLVVSMGHQCSVAETSATAVAMAVLDDFDVILCDYRLASETADAVIAGFVAHAPHLVERTVIATGATTDAGVIDLTTRFGLRLIAKPYGGNELAAIIAEAYRRRN